MSNYILNDISIPDGVDHCHKVGLINN